MFRVIGGAVVYGFALYGAATLLQRQSEWGRHLGGQLDPGQLAGNENQNSQSIEDAAATGPLPAL